MLQYQIHAKYGLRMSWLPVWYSSFFMREDRVAFKENAVRQLGIYRRAVGRDTEYRLVLMKGLVTND